MSAINGESIPVTKEIGDELFAGTVNLSGAIQMEMTKPSSETLFQKIITLVQSAQSEKSPSQQFIERFEGTYVKIVIITVASHDVPSPLFIWLGLDDYILSCHGPACCRITLCTCRIYYASNTCCCFKRSKTRVFYLKVEFILNILVHSKQLLLIKQVH